MTTYPPVRIDTVEAAIEHMEAHGYHEAVKIMRAALDRVKYPLRVVTPEQADIANGNLP